MHETEWFVCLFVCLPHSTAQRHYLGPCDATRAAAACLTLAACGKAACRLQQLTSNQGEYSMWISLDDNIIIILSAAVKNP